VHHLQHLSNGSFAELSLDPVESSALVGNILLLRQQLLGLIVVTLRKGLDFKLRFVIELGRGALVLRDLQVVRALTEEVVILALSVG